MNTSIKKFPVGGPILALLDELIVTTKDGRTLRHHEHINRGAEDRPISVSPRRGEGDC